MALEKVERYVTKNPDGDGPVFIQKVDHGKPFKEIERFLIRGEIQEHVRNDAKSLEELKKSAEYYRMPTLAHECEVLLNAMAALIATSGTTPKKRLVTVPHLSSLSKMIYNLTVNMR